VPAKENRKIMKHGSSGVIAITKPSRDYHNLKPGNTVTILYASLHFIIPKPHENLLHEKAELTDKTLGQTSPGNPK